CDLCPSCSTAFRNRDGASNSSPRSRPRASVAAVGAAERAFGGATGAFPAVIAAAAGEHRDRLVPAPGGLQGVGEDRLRPRAAARVSAVDGEERDASGAQRPGLTDIGPDLGGELIRLEDPADLRGIEAE